MSYIAPNSAGVHALETKMQLLRKKKINTCIIKIHIFELKISNLLGKT